MEALDNEVNTQLQEIVKARTEVQTENEREQQREQWKPEDLKENNE